MKLSVIIPTLNEEASLPGALASVPAGAEVIVSDGRSQDHTAEIATQRGARVFVGPPGRGAQMNLGARAAQGDVLLFLHADCRLGPRAGPAIGDALRDPDVVGGSFRMVILPPRPSLRLVAFGANLRARHLRLPYGDQAIFVRRADFEGIGGFPEIPIMEDVELVRKLRRRGRLAFIADPVTTGARHWATLGPWLTTLLNWTTAISYFAGVSPTRLAPMYFRLRKPGPAGSSSEPPLASIEEWKD